MADFDSIPQISGVLTMDTQIEVDYDYNGRECTIVTASRLPHNDSMHSEVTSVVVVQHERDDSTAASSKSSSKGEEKEEKEGRSRGRGRKVRRERPVSLIGRHGRRRCRSREHHGSRRGRSRTQMDRLLGPDAQNDTEDGQSTRQRDSGKLKVTGRPPRTGVGGLNKTAKVKDSGRDAVSKKTYRRTVTSGLPTSAASRAEGSPSSSAPPAVKAPIPPKRAKTWGVNSAPRATSERALAKKSPKSSLKRSFFSMSKKNSKK